MQQVSLRTLMSSLNKSFAVFFYISWMFGLIFGVGLFFLWEDMFFSLMCLVNNYQVSIVGLLNVLVLPFLLMNLLVHFHCYRLILVLSFLQAALFSCISVFIFFSYGGAGLLIHTFLCSSVCVSSFLFLYFGIRLVSKARTKTAQRNWMCCIIGTGIIDYCMISPFLNSLLNFE